MPRRHRAVRNGLVAKGFVVDEDRSHVVFVYVDLDGRKTTARTLLSHGAGGQDVSDALLGRMARQVHLDRRRFLDLIDCPLDRDEYDRIVRNQDAE